MRKDCWIKSRDIQEELETYFSTVDQKLSSYFESNPDIREEHIESRLATLLETEPLRLYEQRINHERRRMGLSELSLTIKHITHTERAHGADIGLVARLKSPGEAVITKATLIQGKRLYPNRKGFDQQCSYQELFKTDSKTDLPPQYDRMLNITPASIYIFYNPDRMRIKRKTKDVRSRVIDAQTIKAMATAGLHHLTAEDCFGQSRSFSQWMIDEFICCHMGDIRDEVITTALGGNTDFPVRHTVEIGIEAVDTEPSLFMLENL